MAEILPFKGLRYNPEKIKDISKVITPPYDVISEKERDDYYQLHPENIIRLILGKDLPGDDQSNNKYTRSAEFFDTWRKEEILKEEAEPAIYIYAQEFTLSGKKYVRRGFISLVKLEDFQTGQIYPHEHTLAKPKEDRMNLMKACNSNLSQVFTFFEDEDSKVSNLLHKVSGGEPGTGVTPDIDFTDIYGVKNLLWVVKDKTVIEELILQMKDRALFIADGHHRYETSRNFRNFMRARYGRRPPYRSYEYLMMYLTNMTDQGLTVLPSHRLIKRYDNFQLQSFLGKLEDCFDISTVPISNSNNPQTGSNLRKLLMEKGHVDSVIGFHHSGGEVCYLFSLKPGARDRMGDDLHLSLKKLDVLILSRLIFQKALGFSKEDLDDEEIFHYQSDMGKAISLVNSRDFQMVFLLNPTKIDHVREIASDALIMPRKSTYFYPKVLSGLVFNKIDPNEVIQLS